ncbi:hypothetical protein Tco_0664575, partial [Tanacetum coccineum]
GRLMVYKCSRLYTSAIWIEVGMDYNTKGSFEATEAFRMGLDKLAKEEPKPLYRNKVLDACSTPLMGKIAHSSSIKTPMVPLNNLGSDLASKPVNETLYRGMIGSLMYLEVSGYVLKLKAEYVVAAGCNVQTSYGEKVNLVTMIFTVRWYPSFVTTPVPLPFLTI